MTEEAQPDLTPSEVLGKLMEGNARYMAGEPTAPIQVARIAASTLDHHPAAFILTCLDARVPAEMVFDCGIGDAFVGRVAGNIVNDDLLGSMEFATKLVGARLVMVLGHTSCKAVFGACDGVKLGHLTDLLAKITPAINHVIGFTEEERSSSNEAFVEAVTRENVLMTIQNIREKSSILADLEKTGEIMIVGGIYNLGTGQVILLEK
jgi:carbonic anhydrase